MSSIFPGRAIGLALGFAICIVAHHLAHAQIAIRQGDWTSKQYGRTSLSIKAHADVLGSIILPVVWAVAAFFGGFFPFVGWGKPQVLNPAAMRNGRRSLIVVSLAGPVATLGIGILAGIAGRVLLEPGTFLYQVVGGVAVVGIFLFVWEILPMPGRDGGRILGSFLSPTARLKMGELAQYEALFVVGVFLLLPFVVQGIANPICGLVSPAPDGLVLVPACQWLMI